MDRQSVYTLSLFGENANGEDSNRQTHRDLVSFILDFHLDGAYIYRYAFNNFSTPKKTMLMIVKAIK